MWSPSPPSASTWYGRTPRLFYALPFLILTVLLVSIPLLLLVLLGPRADVILPKIRAWMNANSWIVSEFVIVLFLVQLL
jgi:hypothetical protein